MREGGRRLSNPSCAGLQPGILISPGHGGQGLYIRNKPSHVCAGTQSAMDSHTCAYTADTDE